MNTNCIGCVFATLENETQTGCKLDKARKLEILDTQDNHFILKRFCTTYRPEAWLHDLSVQESQDVKKTVLDEVIPRIGFFIILNHDDLGNSIEKLDKTLEDIKNQTLPARYVVIVNDRVEYNQEIQKMLVDKFGTLTKDQFIFHIVQIIQKPQMLLMLIDESFKHAKNGWAYVCYAGENIDRLLIEKIHKRINIDLKMLCVISPYDDNLNGLLFQTSLFKFLNGNKVKTFADTVVDNRSFLDKVKDAAQHSHKDTMITWSEFNES